jgi:hypothetical protein
MQLTLKNWRATNVIDTNVIDVAKVPTIIDNFYSLSPANWRVTTMAKAPIIEQLRQLSEEMLRTRNSFRSIAQLQIAEILTAAKSQLEEVTDAHCITALKKSLKRLEELEALRPLEGDDIQFKWLCNYLLPPTLSDEMLMDAIEQVSGRPGKLTLKNVMSDLANRGEGVDFLVDKRKVVDFVKLAVQLQA